MLYFLCLRKTEDWPYDRVRLFVDLQNLNDLDLLIYFTYFRLVGKKQKPNCPTKMLWFPFNRKTQLANDSLFSSG